MSKCGRGLCVSYLLLFRAYQAFGTSALSGVKEQCMLESQPPPASYWCLVCLYSTLGPSPSPLAAQ